VESYGDYYGAIEIGSDTSRMVIKAEADKFNSTLSKGLKRFESLVAGGTMTAENIFDLYQTYGFPEELSVELAKEKGIVVLPEEISKLKGQHRDVSKQGSEKKFKGGLADSSEKVTQYHTTTHLLNAAMKIVLGSHVSQKGSNITAERLRFDFPHTGKLTAEEKQKIEEIVNEKIREGLPVTSSQLKLEDAMKSGAVGVFGERYPEIVTVYSVGDEKHGYFSREICGGPHVTNTKEITGVFKIMKDEAVSQGVRRVRAVLE
jgi:alanyl-tRNA synthetase